VAATLGLCAVALAISRRRRPRTWYYQLPR
jgi:hypothetical protein